MRNLKRVLSTFLAIAMMMSLVVFSTSAAFNDQDKIVNTDAVNMNVALGIIKGLPDGTFNPTGNVTRAEMAKMICVLLNGGNDPAVGAKGGAATFTDIRGHWAEGYVEYCVAMGIISGMGDGTFAPNANVTATQAAKMLLVALGYDAAFEGFNGASWSVKINVAASQKNLYDDVVVSSVNAPLSRDNAAQMVWNALEAKTVKYNYSLTTVNGQLQNIQSREDKADSLLKTKFNTNTDVNSVMVGYSYNTTDKKFTYTFANGDQFKSKEDFTGLFRLNTTVVYKGTAGTAATVYGMYGNDAKVLATGTLYDLEIDGTAIKFNSTSYKLDNALVDTKVYAENENPVTPLNLTSNALISGTDVTRAYAPYNAKLIDNDNDGKVDCIVYLPFTVAKIVLADTKSVSTNTATYKFEDYSIYSGAAKNDWVMIVDGASAVKDKGTLTKLTAVTGTISSIKSAEKIVMDGKTYLNAATVSGDYASYKIGNKMELITVNGFTFNAKKVAGTVTSDKLAFVIEADAVSTGTDAGKQQVKLMTADGVKKVVKVAKIDGDDVNGVLAAGADNFFDYTGQNGTFDLETIYTYVINKDGNYELDPVTFSTGGTYDNKYTATNSDLDAGKITASSKIVRFADDAVVFYKYGTEYKVATGATVNTWAKYTANVNGTVYVNETNGFNYTQVGFLALNAAPSDKDTKYGYIVANPELVKDGDDYFYQVTIWDGTKDVVYRAESTATHATITSTVADMGNDANAAKGTPVSFKIVSGDKIKTLTALTDKNAVTAYTDGKSYVGFQNTIVGTTELKITSDTVVIRYSSEDKVGQAGTEITVAKETATAGIYALNCYVVANSDKEIEALIIDKDNAVAGTTLTETAAADLTDGVGINNNKIGFNGSLGVANIANVKAYVEGLFSNELTVVVNDNGTTCTTAAVYAPNATPVIYNLVLAGATTGLAGGAIGAPTTAVATETAISGLFTGTETLSFVWNYAGGGNAGALAAGDKVTVSVTAPNGDVMATSFIYTK